MKINKKLLLLTAITFSSLCLEAVQPGKMGTKGGKSEMISMDQLQEMQQMEQLLQAVGIMMVGKFLAKFPKFRLSIISAYKKDSAAVEQKIIAQTNNDSVFDPILSEVLKEIQAEKEMEVMLLELKPLLKQLLAQEVIKWVHITTTAGVIIQ